MGYRGIGHLGNEVHWSMGHMGNRGTGGMRYKGYGEWVTWAMGYMGNRVWGTGV